MRDDPYMRENARLVAAANRLPGFGYSVAATALIVLGFFVGQWLTFVGVAVLVVVQAILARQRRSPSARNDDAPHRVEGLPR